MADTAYQALQKVVSDLQTLLNEKETSLTALKTDPNFISLRTKLNRVGAQPGWIDGAGVYWHDPMAEAQKRTAITQVSEHDQLVNETEMQIADLKLKLQDALTRVTDYEKNSPTLTAQLETEGLKAAAESAASYLAANKQKMIFFAILFLLSVFGLVIFLRKQKKTTNTNTVAA